MISIKFAKVRKITGCRIMLALTGYDGEAVIEALLLMPCGVAGPQVWLPPSVGDVVAVLYDAERPENSVVVGVVYPDGKNPPKTGADEIAIQAKKVYIGDDVSATKPCPRDDHVQDELKAIKSELDAIKSAFSGHIHSLPPMQAGPYTVTGLPSGEGPGNTGAGPLYAQGYTVGSTASDSVEVK
ncbi:MAG: hypothetical protein IKO51_08670 [Clostridia bacterium]|nr:hypothetical protein [Fibrobacter sp.]MBR4636419.1 hypothetical protein [Clostridia bacterium]